jgi:hypothetical protein
MNRPAPTSCPRGAPSAPRAAWFAGLAGALFAAATLAQAPMVILEEVLESSTSLAELPATAGGSFSARECRDCGSYRVKFDAATRYYVGDERVSYTRFRQVAAQGNTRLYVYYKPGTQVLTRLRISAPAKPTQ